MEAHRILLGSLRAPHSHFVLGGMGMSTKPEIQQDCEGEWSFSYNEQTWGPFATFIEALKERDIVFPPPVDRGSSDTDFSNLDEVTHHERELDQNEGMYEQQLTLLKQINWRDKTLAYLLADELSGEGNEELAGQIATFMSRVMKYMEVD